MSSKLTETAPQRIWLCVSDDQDDYELSYSDLRDNEADITWSSDQPVDCTIEYVRADIAESELAAANEKLRAFEHYVMTGRNEQHDRLVADLEAARADAERYRWLRKVDAFAVLTIAWRDPAAVAIGADCDKAIDAALARETTK